MWNLAEKRRLHATRKSVMTQKRRQKKSKKTKKSQSDLSDNGSFDGSTAPLSYTARGRTHQGGSPGDLESDRALSPPVTSHRSSSHRSTSQRSTNHQSASHRSTSHWATSSVIQSLVIQSPVNQLPVNQSLVNQSLVNQSPVIQSLVNQAPFNQALVTSHSHMTFKLNLFLVIHQSKCLYKIMLLL